MLMRHHASPAFTLIELLVVIGIIAALSAILLPVLGMVRDGARKAVCASNLRQIGIAMLAYANDCDQILPGRTNGVAAEDRLGDYFGSSKRDDDDPSVRWSCPANKAGVYVLAGMRGGDSQARIQNGIAKTVLEPRFFGTRRSDISGISITYAGNYRIMGWYAWDEPANNGWKSYTSEVTGQTVVSKGKLSRLQRHSSTITFMDQTLLFNSDRDGVMVWIPYTTIDSYRIDGSSNDSSSVDPHRRSSNVVYLDGHVGSYRAFSVPVAEVNP
jgi:prepilin-type N-terminal cleavage/methylation domain-containing protein/prepilin-type processing-associated H-X9-DG protein